MDGMLITGQAGFLSGTHVASNLGWCRVDNLSVGDKVLTFDNGMRPVIDIQREIFCTDPAEAPRSFWPIFVPIGALDNRVGLFLMPEQGVLLEAETTRDALGDPFAVVPARALQSITGVNTRAPEHPLEVTILSFDTDEVVYVEGGLRAHCPRPRTLLTDEARAMDDVYNVLPLPEAKKLVAAASR
jgi:hypothetical protein